MKTARAIALIAINVCSIPNAASALPDFFYDNYAAVYRQGGGTIVDNRSPDATVGVNLSINGGFMQAVAHSEVTPVISSLAQVAVTQPPSANNLFASSRSQTIVYFQVVSATNGPVAVDFDLYGDWSSSINTNVAPSGQGPVYGVVGLDVVASNGSYTNRNINFCSYSTSCLNQAASNLYTLNLQTNSVYYMVVTALAQTFFSTGSSSGAAYGSVYVSLPSSSLQDSSFANVTASAYQLEFSIGVSNNPITSVPELPIWTMMLAGVFAALQFRGRASGDRSKVRSAA